jgi:hypothetical protein
LSVRGIAKKRGLSMKKQSDRWRYRVLSERLKRRRLEKREEASAQKNNDGADTAHQEVDARLFANIVLFRRQE